MKQGIAKGPSRPGSRRSGRMFAELPASALNTTDEDEADHQRALRADPAADPASDQHRHGG